MLGRVIAAKKGKGVPPLVGRGFDKSVDGLTYTAAIDGKIERHKNRIIILPILEINGDVDVGTGNIDFCRGRGHTWQCEDRSRIRLQSPSR